MIRRQRGSALTIALPSGLGLIFVILMFGMAMNPAIGSAFTKNGGSAAGPGASGTRVTKVLFVGDSVTKGFAGGFDTEAQLDAGQPATPNAALVSALGPVGITFNSYATTTATSSTILKKELTPALADKKAGYNGLVLMTSVNDGTDSGTTTQNITTMVQNAQQAGLVVFAVTLYPYGGRADVAKYVKEVNDFLKTQSNVTLVDISGMSVSGDATTADMSAIQTKIKNALTTYNSNLGNGLANGSSLISGNYIHLNLLDQHTTWTQYGGGDGGGLCGVTSVKMALDYYKQRGYKYLTTAGLDNASYYRNFIGSSLKVQGAWEHFLQGGRGQMVKQSIASDNWKLATASTQNGHPVVSYGTWIRGSSGHIVVIVGVTSSSVIIADPYGGKFRSLGKEAAASLATGYSNGGSCSTGGCYLYNNKYRTEPLN